MPTLTRDVTDLLVGTRIPTEDAKVGILTVLGTYFEPAAEGLPAYVEVDVTCDPNADIWDLPVFAASVGAESASWLSNTPRRRYRLYYPATATVATIDD